MHLTEQHPCETLASVNLAPGCAKSVDRYEHGDLLMRPVVWLQSSFHHVPRDEDEPVMDEHWQGFSLQPRDPTATDPNAHSNGHD